MDPLVLVAGELWLEITAVSGSAALSLEENLNPVPGAASASDWMLHVPQVEPMAKLVRVTVKRAGREAAGDPRGDAEHPQHQRRGAGELLAVAALVLEQERLERILVIRDLLAVGEVALEPRADPADHAHVEESLRAEEAAIGARTPGLILRDRRAGILRTSRRKSRRRAR